MKKLTLTTSWDDGYPLDIKIAEMLKKYHLPGIFYIPINNSKNENHKVLSKSEINSLAKDFEIGAHTLTHPDLTKISLKEAGREIRKSKEELENIIGKPVTRFCYPKGRYNQEIIALVKTAGFNNARTTNWFRTDKEFNPYVEPTTIHFYPHPIYVNIGHCFKWQNFNGLCYYAIKGFPASLIKLSQSFLLKAVKEDGVFHLWGHSWEIDQLGLWKHLEKVLKMLSEITSLDD